MHPSSFDESTEALDPPRGMEDDCDALSVWRGPVTGYPCVISCWKPTQEELDEITKTGRVWLYIWGGTMPPAYIAGTHPFVTDGTEEGGEDAGQVP